MNEQIFRAYDIRGVYPKEINEDIAYMIGQSYGSYLREYYKQNTCVVSHDNRISSDSLTDSLINGIIKAGCNVINLGLTTTPMNYYARYYYKLPGIMVTASHNPKDDNGFKFSFDGMINARGKMIDDFKEYTLKGNYKTGQGTITNADIKEKYLNYLKQNRHYGKNKRKVVIDPGNGAACTIIKEVFASSFCTPIYINDVSDGTFPNHHPDPAVPENMVQLQKAVTINNADFGIAYDGDADRLGIVMNNGKLLPIEYFMIICINDMYKRVQNKTFLYDIKCSKSVDDYIRKLGGTPLCYRTGASYTEYKVHEDNLPFGCEYSGHVYFRDQDIDCCSAIYASLRFLEIMSKTDNALSEIIKDFPFYFSTPEIKISSNDKLKFIVTDEIKKYAIENNYIVNDIDGVRITFDDGWVLVRASNTGPNITFRAEATTKEKMLEYQEKYIELIKKYNNI